jgi:hypothetical protein
MSEVRAFEPLYTPNQGNATGTIAPSVSVTALATVVASTAFSGNSQAANYKQQIQIANTTNAWAYVNFGVLSASQAVIPATVAASYPVAPGAVVVVTVDKEVNAASVILGAASTGGTTVIFTRGEGIG